MTFTNVYGITIGNSSASGALNSQAITDMQNLGVTWLRYQVRWSLIDATGTTNQNAATYSWGAYDSAVSQCNAAGINILLSIMFAPSQFQGPGGNPLNPSYTATFASQIATRYNGGAHGTVNAIEVGNEDYNSGADTTSIPVPLVQQLALTMKAVYPAIKAVSSAITVGVACKLQRNTAGYTAFFDTLLNPATGPYISSVFQGDYINFHYYGCLPTSGGNPVSMDPTVDLPSWNGGNGLPSIKHAWQLIDAKRTQYSQTVPIWLTEAGYQVNANPGRAPACNNSEALAWQYDNAVLDSLRTSGVVSKWFRFTLGYYAGYTAPNYRDGMSLVQGTLASPHYTTAYNQLKNYTATYPTWGSGTGTTWSASPNSLAFSATTGGANPANQTVTLSNTAGSSASYTVVDSAAWMSVSPTSGSVAAGGTANSTISVNIGGLTAGTYTGSVTWTAGGQSDTTSVVLTVSDVTPPPPPGVTPLTAYFANAASLVVPTANQVYTIPGTPIDANTASTLGTATGWGELIAQGTTAPWAAASVIGGPSGFGFLYGARALEGNDLQAGTYTGAVRLNMIGAGAVSITADIHIRGWLWNAATGYSTLIVDLVQAGQTILTTKTTFAPTATSSIPTSFGKGDKLYWEIKVKVLTNTGPATAQIQLNDLSTDTVTFMGSSTASVVTPGYSATVGGGGGGGGGGGSGTPPLGPLGSWTLIWNDEFDDTAGMSGPTHGLSAAKWNGGWFNGPSSPGVGVNAISDPINTGSEIDYFGPAGILFPGDDAVHLRLQAGVDNGGTYHTKTVEGGFLSTAGLMNLNPSSTPVQTSGPDLRPYTINGPLVIEVRMRIPGPNASSTHYWPGMALFNAGNYGGTSPWGGQWPGGQNYLQEIDLVECFGGGSLGINSTLNFHAASTYSSAGIPDSLTSVDLSLAYHTYTYAITTNTFLAWVDGIPAIAIAPTAAQIAAQFVVPMYLNFQFSATAGATYPTTAASTPSDMMIDYVRVWTPAVAPKTPSALTIGNAVVNMVSGSLQGKSKVGRRGELSASVYDALGANHYQQYQEMALFDQFGNVGYSGYLTSPVETKPGFSPMLLTSFTATDQHYLADKRIVANLYRNKTCGFIVQDIVTNILAAEGVTVGEIDAGLTIPIANFGYCTVATALDALVAAASGNGIPFYWVIDQNQVLWFVPYTAITGPTVDGTTIDDGRRSGVTPSVTRANPKYRNTQYAVGGFQENGPWDETRQGDGQTRAFTFSYPLNAAPTTFTLNGTAKSIAIKGTVGAQYYWAPNDPVIAQDPTQTILVSTDRLHMIYSGQSPAVFNNQHVDQVAYMAGIDGTSGIVEAVINDPTINSFAQGQSVVGQALTRYCTQGALFTFATLNTGLAPGQLIAVSYAPFGFSGTQMLVDEVGFSDQQDGFNLWYTVTAVMGPYDTNWTDFFGNIISPGLGIAQSINIGVAIAVPLYPNSTLFPGDVLYPS